MWKARLQLDLIGKQSDLIQEIYPPFKGSKRVNRFINIIACEPLRRVCSEQRIVIMLRLLREIQQYNHSSWIIRVLLFEDEEALIVFVQESKGAMNKEISVLFPHLQHILPE